MEKLIFVVIFAIGFISCEETKLPSINDLSHQLQNIPGIENLPLNESSVPSTEEAKNMLKQKCEKAGGPTAFTGVETATGEIEQCIRNIVNVTVIQEEIEEHKKTGSLEVVFKKYCNKRSVLKECIENFTIALDPCLEEAEKDTERMILNITDSLMNFICFKDGDRIAMFIAEKGFECISENEEAIKQCANATVSKHIPAEAPTIDNLPLLLFKDQECADMLQLQECIGTKLQQCKDPTPANIIDSLFNYILKATPCRNMVVAREKSTNFADHMVAKLSVLITTFSLLLLV